jgi:hypothetical protein
LYTPKARKGFRGEVLMLEQTSRYHSIETATLATPDGRVIVYVRRRFLPRGQDMQLLAEVAVTEGDRLDLIAARTLGDAEQFWRICDANDAMRPDDLTAEPNRTLRIALPGVEG